MSSDGQFKQESERRFSVAGHLGFSSVRDVLSASEPLLRTGNADAEIDLSKVDSADSAGLALLIEWYCSAQRANRTLRFVNVPEPLRALARISDIDAILPFA